MCIRDRARSADSAVWHVNKARDVELEWEGEGGAETRETWKLALKPALCSVGPAAAGMRVIGMVWLRIALEAIIKAVG